MNAGTLGVMIPILVPLGSFAMVVLIVYLVMKNQANIRNKRHEEVVALIEKGQFDPDMLEKLEPPKKPKTPLYRGMVWLGCGVGITLALLFIPEHDLHEIWALGLIPSFIGLAMLIYHFIARKSEKKEQSPA